MPMFLYRCGKCGARKKHFIADGSARKVACVKCGESVDYSRMLGNFQTIVNYKTVEEIIENEIDPSVERVWAKMGKEIVNGDVQTMENVFGENKMKETYYENDTWIDPDEII